ncbi:Diaminopimelate epimerase-like protein [Fistulina hepatica ATCC 64428]|uniref:Diaminopimelate epimerase-like protein n=1 Tax=Fistulina hepatica ATCC 64428 TaxID=1128425 RepID=A0A0D7AKF9_9AGAR|nr:Diaminopimelate epimerase-like protein [Fistulina hepatica ATCC 64428]
MTTLKYSVVDAFTTVPFGGNPAAVIVLDTEATKALPDITLQRVAREFNLSETAFIYPIEPQLGRFRLRWFTPTKEVPLCGHATLAASFVIFKVEIHQYFSPAPTVRPDYVLSAQQPLPRSHSRPLPPSDEWVQVPHSASHPDMRGVSTQSKPAVSIGLHTTTFAKSDAAHSVTQLYTTPASKCQSSPRAVQLIQCSISFTTAGKRAMLQLVTSRPAIDRRVQSGQWPLRQWRGMQLRL